MFGLFKKKLKGAGAELANKSIKAENKDLMEAMVGVAALITFADGELEDSEIESTTKLIDNSKALEAFGTEPSQLFDSYCKQLEAGYRMGRMTILREVEDCKSNKEDAEMVLIMAIEIAFSDGECEPEEEKELNTIAQKLGLKIGDYI